MSADDLPPPGGARELLLPGAAGNLEVLLAAPRGTPRGCAVICHPHPLGGGAMSNKVTYTLASIALKAGCHALRFNFRGVGRSQGRHDDGVGEADDTVLLAQWLRARAPGLPLLLAGFSFGGYVSLSAAARLQPSALVGIAPPFVGGRYFKGAVPPPHPRCPWLVVHSRDDEVVPFEETQSYLQTYDPPPELAVVDGAGHFFHGRLGDLQQIVEPFLQRSGALG